MSAPPHHPILGRLVAFLGSVGVLLCLVAFFYLWEIGGRINRAAAAAQDQLEHHLTAWVDVATDTRTGIERTRTVVRALEEHIRRQLTEALTPTPEALAELAELEASLHSSVQQVGHWLDTADTLMAVAEQMLAALESTGLFTQFKPEGYQQLLDALASGRDEITQVQEWERGLTEEANTVRQGLRSTKGLPRITRLSDQLDGSLVNLGRYADDFQTAAGRVIEATAQLEQQIRLRIRLVQCVLSALLLWQAGAHACLLGRGRQWYVTHSSPTS